MGRSISSRLRGALPGKDGWPDGLSKKIYWGVQEEQEYVGPEVNCNMLPEHLEREAAGTSGLGNLSPGVGCRVVHKDPDYLILQDEEGNSWVITTCRAEQIRWGRGPLPSRWFEALASIPYPPAYLATAWQVMDSQGQSAPGGPTGFPYLLGIISMLGRSRALRSWRKLDQFWKGQPKRAMEALGRLVGDFKEAQSPGPSFDLSYSDTPRLPNALLADPTRAAEIRIDLGMLQGLFRAMVEDLYPELVGGCLPKDDNGMTLAYRVGATGLYLKNVILSLGLPPSIFEGLRDSTDVGKFCVYPNPSLPRTCLMHGSYYNICAGVNVRSWDRSRKEYRTGAGMLTKVGASYFAYGRGHGGSHRESGWPIGWRHPPQRWWEALYQVNRRVPSSYAGALAAIRGIPSLCIVGVEGEYDHYSPGSFWMWPSKYSTAHSYSALPTIQTEWEGSPLLPKVLPVPPVQVWGPQDEDEDREEV